MARVVFEVDVNAAPREVVRALDSESGIAGWWTEDVAFAGGPGSTMTLGFSIAPHTVVPPRVEHRRLQEARRSAAP
jgi:uncharacterized protein YndB with AHSA1/START domain